MRKADWIKRAQERMLSAKRYTGPISGALGPLTVQGMIRTINAGVGVQDVPLHAQIAEEISKQMAVNPISASPERLSRFLAECAIESSFYRRLTENLNYTKAETLRKTWPSRFKTIAAAAPFVRNPEGLANNVYAGRMGNNNPGDGWRYRGRGILQTTGRNNYVDLSKATGIDYVGNPDLLATPEHAVKSAIHFWTRNNLNTWIDRGQLEAVSNIINTGQPTRKAHGLAERNAAYARLRGLWI